MKRLKLLNQLLKYLRQLKELDVGTKVSVLKKQGWVLVDRIFMRKGIGFACCFAVSLFGIGIHFLDFEAGWMDRNEAVVIAYEAGQISIMKNELFSEDIY